MVFKRGADGGEPLPYHARRVSPPTDQVALPPLIIALRSLLYWIFARAITPSKSSTMHFPNPRAGVNVPPLPDETLVSVPLRFVSEARTEPIAFAITNLCVYVNIINPSPHEWGKGGPVY